MGDGYINVGESTAAELTGIPPKRTPQIYKGSKGYQCWAMLVMEIMNGPRFRTRWGLLEAMTKIEKQVRGEVS